MGYRAMVPFHFHEHASMGKWSGFTIFRNQNLVLLESLSNKIIFTYFVPQLCSNLCTVIIGISNIFHPSLLEI